MELSQFNHISLPKDRVYTYKAFVSKKFRGKRIRNAIDIYLNEMFKENGKRFVVSTVAKNNMPSIKTKERSGFKRIGKIIHFRFFGLEYDYIKKEDLSYLQSL